VGWALIRKRQRRANDWLWHGITLIELRLALIPIRLRLQTRFEDGNSPIALMNSDDITPKAPANRPNDREDDSDPLPAAKVNAHSPR
jgi:hypothetical protein